MLRLLPILLLAACATARPDAAWIVASEITQVRIPGHGDAAPRTITDRAELERLAGCLAPADAPPAHGLQGFDIDGVGRSAGRWFFAAKRGQVWRLEMSARPPGQLAPEDAACAAQALAAPTP